MSEAGDRANAEAACGGSAKGNEEGLEDQEKGKGKVKERFGIKAKPRRQIGSGRRTRSERARRPPHWTRPGREARQTGLVILLNRIFLYSSFVVLYYNVGL